MTQPLAELPALYGAALTNLSQRKSDASPTWLAKLRQQASERFRTHGLPHPKAEAWRLAPLERLTQVAFSHASTPPDLHTVAFEASAPWTPLMVVDGYPQLADHDREQVEVAQLAALTAEQQQAIAFHLGHAASSDDAFVALNTAMFPDAVWLKFAKQSAPATPRYVVHGGSASTAPTVAHPRVVITVEENASAVVIEHFVGAASDFPYLCNSVCEIILAKGAKLEHVRIFESEAHDQLLSHVAVRQERGSRYVGRCFSLRGGLRREDVHVALAGEGCEARMEGVYLSHDGEFSGHYVLADHASAHASSHQRYRGVLQGKSQGVFDGTVIVERDAQQTVADQQNRNLLLSPDAVVHTKPHLQIDADNVKCSHGATVGRLDSEQLFYLRSRGLGAAEAEALLSYAFVRELVDAIEQPELRAFVASRVHVHMPHAQAALEVAP